MEASERVAGIEVQQAGQQGLVPLMRDARTSFLYVGGPTHVTRTPGNVQLNRSFSDGRPRFTGTLIEARRAPASSDFGHNVISIDGTVYEWDDTHERKSKKHGVLHGTYKKQ